VKGENNCGIEILQNEVYFERWEKRERNQTRKSSKKWIMKIMIII
jgi:hypothetical protein